MLLDFNTELQHAVPSTPLPEKISTDRSSSHVRCLSYQVIINVKELKEN